MGVDTHIHIGPYLEIIMPGKTYEEKSVNLACRNTKCKKNGLMMNTNFCPECGKEMTKETKTFNIPLDAAEINLRMYKAGMVDDLVHTDNDMFIANQSGPFDINTNGEEPTSLEKIDVIGAKSWFKEKYKKEIAFIRDLVGAEDVGYAVKFGFFKHYS